MATTPVTTPCPLCGNEIYIAKMLYGYPVCAKCHQDFAIKRALGHFLDNLIMQLILTVVFFIFFFGGSIILVPILHGSDDASARLVIFLFLVGMLLVTFIVLAKDGFSGHSPAKYLLGMQVIDSVSGRPINMWDSFQRNLPLVIPFMPIVVLIQLFTGDGKRMGDGWAHTKVILKQYRDRAPFLARRELQAQMRARIVAQTPGA